jgi:hypothetical protein
LCTADEIGAKLNDFPSYDAQKMGACGQRRLAEAVKRLCGERACPVDLAIATSTKSGLKLGAYSGIEGAKGSLRSHDL